MAGAPLFPDAAMTATRQSANGQVLPLLEGTVPAALGGHLFVLSPVGTVDSGGAPYPDGNNRPTVINGDGMVWRFDFASGQATLTSDIVKPPDYWVDELTRTGSPADFLGFVDMGMLRASLFFGTRNFANTAFVPMPPQGLGPGPTRLICCYDAGPPVEIDPATLATHGVVGESWEPEALGDLVPFPPILATAHPYYDAHTGEFFAVNYGRSALSMIETIPLFEALAFLPEVANNIAARIAAALGRAPRLLGFDRLAGAARWVHDFVAGVRDIKIPRNFLNLVRWKGTGDVELIRVVDGAGQDVVVEQSMHQIACTRRFIVLMDTNFKLRFDQFYNNPFPGHPDIERLLRTALASQQGAVSNVWIIRRSDLPAVGAPNPWVRAYKVPIRGAVHFLADYDDSAGIVFHAAHGAALDIAEWVRTDDQMLSGDSVRQIMHGMVASPIDVSRLGRYRIDADELRVVESQLLSDDALWGIALYAGRGVPPSGLPPEKLRHAFWFSSGLWSDNYTLFLRGLYMDYLGRLVPLSDVDRLVKSGGKPSTLVCVDVDTMTIVDRFDFPAGVSLSSPQFIPDTSVASPGSRDGWLTTVVWTATESQLWIFDARSLAAPVAKLSVPTKLGFSLHSAWLPDFGTPTDGATPRAPSPDAWRSHAMTRLERLRKSAKKRLDPLRRILDELP